MSHDIARETDSAASAIFSRLFPLALIGLFEFGFDRLWRGLPGELFFAEKYRWWAAISHSHLSVLRMRRAGQMDRRAASERPL